MMLEGVVESLSRYVASGWVRLSVEDEAEAIDPVIVQVFCRDRLVGTGVANGGRPDLKSEKSIAYGFRFNLDTAEDDFFGSGEIKVLAVFRDEKLPLKLLKSVEIALALNGQPRSLLKQVIECCESSVVDVFSELLDFNKNQFHKAAAKKSTCVIAYANDSGAWFPYFYKYYSEIVGCLGIYIVTPKPEGFSSYVLGGVITIPDLVYDDNSRSLMMSNFSSGFLAYYRWCLVCDVDEIVIPHPKLKTNLLEYLESKTDDVILSLGIDVIQLSGESEFDFQKSVLEQRKYGVLNSAMCKPHATRVPIRYSGGYHYCDRKLDFYEAGGELLTLHLKWACSRVRKEVANIVKGVSYTDPAIEKYSLTSVLHDFHPLVAKNERVKIFDLDDGVVEDFKEKYRKNLKFDPKRGMWVGLHRSENFLIRLDCEY